MLTGESPKFTFDQFLKAIETVKNIKTDKSGEIRRVNVEIPSLTVSDFRRLKATDAVGTYVLFQETYHYDTFKKMHPSGEKGKFENRLQTMDRSFIAGNYISY
jgi:2-iminoacetate synthase